MKTSERSTNCRYASKQHENLKVFSSFVGEKPKEADVVVIADQFIRIRALSPGRH